MFEAPRAMSRELTADAIERNATFPFVAFPNFEIYAKQARENAGLEVITYTPVVTAENAEPFMKFAAENQDLDFAQSPRRHAAGSYAEL